MLTINAAQLQAFAAFQRARFLAEVQQAHGAALAASPQPLDAAGLAAFVEMLHAGGIDQEDALALLVELRARGGAALFARPEVQTILADFALTGRLKAFQINLVAERMRA